MLDINNIYNIDCIEGMKQLPDNLADITITSPPYNLGEAIRSDRTGHKTKVTISNVYDGYEDNLSDDKYYELIYNAIKQMLRVTKYYVFFNFQKLSSNKQIYNKLMWDYHNNIKEEFIWAKTNPAPAIHPHVCASGFEYIICLAKHDDARVRNFDHCNFNNREKTSGKVGRKHMSNCLIHTGNMDNLHEDIKACFPFWLPEFFITNFSFEKDIVLDPFMGSGTVAITAKKLKRNYIGFELDKKRCDKIIERLDKVIQPWF